MADLKECPNCAVDIPREAAVCRICGYDFPRRKPIPWKPVAAVLLVVLLLPLLRLVLRALGG